MNCGLYHLRLVHPREDHLSAKAISASSNAEEILYNAEVFDTTEQAIADLNYVLATTSRHRDQVKPVLNANRAAEILDDKIANGSKGGILFGPERTGLNNHDVCLSERLSIFRLIPVIVLLTYHKQFFWPDMNFTNCKLKLQMNNLS